MCKFCVYDSSWHELSYTLCVYVTIVYDMIIVHRMSFVYITIVYDMTFVYDMSRVYDTIVYDISCVYITIVYDMRCVYVWEVCVHNRI